MCRTFIFSWILSMQRAEDITWTFQTELTSEQVLVNSLPDRFLKISSTISAGNITAGSFDGVEVFLMRLQNLRRCGSFWLMVGRFGKFKSIDKTINCSSLEIHFNTDIQWPDERDLKPITGRNFFLFGFTFDIQSTSAVTLAVTYTAQWNDVRFAEMVSWNETNRKTKQKTFWK